MMAMRGLRVPADATWYHDFRGEILHFPIAPHDDVADCLRLCGQILDRMRKGSPLPQKTPPKNIFSITLPELFEANESVTKRARASGNKQTAKRLVEIDLLWRRGILGQGPAAAAID